MPDKIQTIGPRRLNTAIAKIAAQYGVDPTDDAAVNRFLETLDSRPIDVQRKIADDIEALTYSDDPQGQVPDEP